MDGARKSWYEGSSDPLCQARSLTFEPDQSPDPRQFGRRVELAVEIDITIQDPVRILMECEQLDEEQNVEKGTNFNQFIQLNSITR